MIILPSTYLGSVEYFAYLAQHGGECVIDTGEHYIKRSERNRARIMTANGVMPLSVHIVDADRPRTPVRDIRIDYSKRWQHLHRTALMSAYGSSPYFDHYEPYLAPFYEKRYEFLLDYNTELTELLLRLGHVGTELKFSDTYVSATDEDTDLRIKKRESAFASPEYFQMFSDRLSFAPNLSFIDLLFSEGPSSIGVLRRCRL